MPAWSDEHFFNSKSPFKYGTGMIATYVYGIGGGLTAFLCGVALTLKNRKFAELQKAKEQKPSSALQQMFSNSDASETFEAHLKAFEQHKIKPRHLSSLTRDDLVMHLGVPLGTAIDMLAVFAKGATPETQVTPFANDDEG